MDKNLVFTTDETIPHNWHYQKYYKCNAYPRFYTFQIALNLLSQRHESPIIIETGCQRELEDFGAGMSTSIFAEYVQSYGGKLITVDNCEEHLNRAKAYVSRFPDANVEFVLSDSVQYLKDYKGYCRLLYLDSLDYPVGEDAGNLERQQAAQEHNLNEFLAAEDKLLPNTILLLDDNTLPGGGKPKLLKEVLLTKGWTCLLDSQGSLWVKEI